MGEQDIQGMTGSPGETIITTSQLSKLYQGVTAVENLDLEIRRGEIFGLLGPNGAGKTTTTLMLLGLTEPTSGTARIKGFDCTREPIEVKKIVGYLPDNVGFYPDMTGRENLIFTGEMNGLPRALCRERAASLLERVGMSYAADRKAGTYSRGMRQRLGIADVLMKDPEIIIMDEPTLGIDPEGMRELTRLIRELAVRDGRTILLSSHQLYQVQEICDRVGIFVSGRLIACGRIEELGRQLENKGLYLLDLQVEQDSAPLASLVEGLGGVTRVVREEENGSLHIESTRDLRREMIGFLMLNNYTLLDMHQRGGDLEEIYRKYFEIAGEEDEEDGAAGSERQPGGLQARIRAWRGRRSGQNRG